MPITGHVSLEIYICSSLGYHWKFDLSAQHLKESRKLGWGTSIQRSVKLTQKYELLAEKFMKQIKGQVLMILSELIFHIHGSTRRICHKCHGWHSCMPKNIAKCTTDQRHWILWLIQHPTVQSRNFNKLWNLMTKRNTSDNFDKTYNPIFWPKTSPRPLWIVNIKQINWWPLLRRPFSYMIIQPFSKINISLFKIFWCFFGLKCIFGQKTTFRPNIKTAISP